MVRYWLVRMRPDIDTDPEDDFWKLTEDSVLLTLLVYLRFMALGLRPHTPGEAPPMAGFIERSLVA